MQFDLNAFYFSDSIDSGTAFSNNRMVLDLSGAINLSHKGQFVLGWSYSIMSYGADGAAAVEASTTDTGPRIGWFIDRRRSWSVNLTYNLFANTTFNDGTEDLKWRGKSYKVDFGYAGFVSDRLAFGVRMNYYAASYSEQFDAADSFSQVSTSQNAIFPSFSATYFLN